MKKTFTLFLFCLLAGISVQAQQINMNLNEFRSRKDSTATTEDLYPHVFPIWGENLAQKGINFPLPLGINVTYMSTEMQVDITDFSLAIGDYQFPELVSVPVDREDPSKGNELITFQEALGLDVTMTNLQSVNTRFDVWLLPFLNVYGLYTYMDGSTTVSILDRQLQQPLEFVTAYSAHAYGLGTTLSYGVKGFFFTTDINKNWTMHPMLDEAVDVNVVSERVGKTFNFKKERQLALWVGASWKDFSNDDIKEGAIKFADLEMDPNTTPMLHDLFARYPEKEITYSIGKSMAYKWSYVAGGQYQINKNWMVRGEYMGTPSSHTFMLGVNYRFGLR